MKVRGSWATILITAMVLGLLAAPAHAAPEATADDPFAGVGTWVSIFMDTWDSPREHVRRMHERGVTTLYLQTSSSQTPVNQKIFQRAKVGRFIDAAHARGMKVVAWYLPPLANVPVEYDRAMAAIRFRSSSGQRFDGFALDIEPSARTPDVPKRNENLLRLSRKIRRSVAAGYPLGAIIPSPIGLRRSPEFWPQFPYEGIGRYYDTIVPMSYHTYRVDGPEAVYEYTRKNIAILRRHYGSEVRIHMIGGEAGASNGRETRAFVRAANDARVLGASLWHYDSHATHDWEALRRLHSASATPLRVAAQEPEAQAPPEPLGVTVSTDHDAFSPNGDGRKDTVTMTARASRPAVIRLELRDSAGELVRRWPASAPDARTLQVTWGGRAAGQRLADGRYVIRATATDADEVTGAARQPLRVDTRSPRLRVRRLPHPFDASEPLKVRYGAWGGPRGVGLRVELRDLGVIRTKSVHRASGRGTLEIAPRYGDGHRLLPGEYRVAVTAADAAGNRTTRGRRLVVIRPTAARVFERVETTRRQVALTFDDCHLTGGWTSILDTLERRDVRATFFCPGDRLELYPALGRRTVAEGHVPASHGWDHRMMSRLSYSSVKRRLQRDQAAWARLGGTAVPYFRPPYGDFDATVLAAAGAAGYARVMMWDIDSLDWTGVSGARLVCNATCKAKPGSVILLHTNSRTAAALPAILDRLERRRLQPVGLPDLFRSAGYH